MKRMTIILVLFGILCLVVIVLIRFLPSRVDNRNRIRIDPGKNSLRLIHYGLDRYWWEQGQQPAGTDAEVNALLSGKNRFGKPILPDRCYNEKQEVVDVWGTPVQYAFFDGGTFSVKSAGPDMAWGSKDDCEYTLPLDLHRKAFPPRSLTTESQYR